MVNPIVRYGVLKSTEFFVRVNTTHVPPHDYTAPYVVRVQSLVNSSGLGIASLQNSIFWCGYSHAEGSRGVAPVANRNLDSNCSHCLPIVP